MVLAVTARQSGNSGQSPEQTLTTDSATENANSLSLTGSAAQNDLHTASQNGQSLSGGGLTYTQVVQTALSAYDGTANFRMRGALHSAPVGGSPAAHTITVDHYIEGAGGDEGFYCVVAVDVTGFDPTTPIREVAGSPNVGTNAASLSSGDSHSGTVTLPNAPVSGNGVLAFFFAGADGGGGFEVGGAPTLGGQPMVRLFNQNDSWTQAGCWFREIDGTESDDTVTCPDLGQSVGQYNAIAVELLAEAAGGETVTLAGTLPVLIASFDIDAGADVQLIGTLPALTADFNIAAEADVQLDGTLPALTGSLTVDAGADVQLAGTLPALTADFSIQTEASVDLTGTLPGLVSSFDIATTADVALIGTLPMLTGDFAISTGLTNVQLAGTLPALSSDFSIQAEADLQINGTLPVLIGSFDVDGSADVELAGTLPALTGDFTIATPGSVVLVGILPALAGDFDIDATTDVELAGALPALTGSFIIVTPSTVVLVGTLPALQGAFLIGVGAGPPDGPHTLVVVDDDHTLAAIDTDHTLVAVNADHSLRATGDGHTLRTVE